jgi:hypothetical protein
MKFQIEIDMDNAAFDPHAEVELRRILINITNKLRISYESETKFKSGNCKDLNGNIVGNWKVF